MAEATKPVEETKKRDWADDDDGQDDEDVEIGGSSVAQIGAARKIDAVAADYQPRLAGVTDPAERQALLREADGKMIALVERDGLSVDEYNGISVAVQQNPALRQRVVDMLARSQGG